MKQTTRCWTLIITLLLLIAQQAIAAQPARIAIIIDDLGNNLKLDLAFTQLPGPIACSILPHRPFSKRIAQAAKLQNQEILLHAPMEAQHGKHLGKGALHSQMSKTKFRQTLHDDINSLPALVGINNHMGSKLTRDSLSMSRLMQALQDQSLFFVDSRTTSNSIAEPYAKAYAIPSIHRDVFLDNVNSYKNIDREFKRLIRLAKKRGQAVAIGHPHQSTLQYLKNNLAKLQENGVKLVTVSELVRTKKQL